MSQNTLFPPMTPRQGENSGSSTSPFVPQAPRIGRTRALSSDSPLPTLRAATWGTTTAQPPRYSTTAQTIPSASQSAQLPHQTIPHVPAIQPQYSTVAQTVPSASQPAQLPHQTIPQVPAIHPRLPIMQPVSNATQNVHHPLQVHPVNVNHLQRQYMPARGEHAAPKFDGHPHSLQLFFDEIETLGRECGLTEREQITYALRYLQPREYEIWRNHPSAKGTSWNDFKKELTSMYPGSEEHQRYTINDLELLTEHFATTKMTSKYHFGEYYRQFTAVANWLMEAQEITKRERNKLFMAGLPRELRERVRNQLRFVEPFRQANHPWEMADVVSTTRYVLDSTGNDGPDRLAMFIPSASTNTHQSSLVTPPPPQRETFDLSAIDQYFASSYFMDQLMARLTLQSQAGAAVPTSMTSIPQPVVHTTIMPTQPAARQRNNNCAFCSDPTHYHHSCPHAIDYIQRGLCKRDESNRIALLDGTVITMRLAPGKNIKERLDNWHRNRMTAAAPAALTNIFEIAPVVSMQTISTQQEVPVEMENPDVTTQELEELRMLDTVVVASLKKAEDIRKRIENTAKGKATRGTKAAAKTDNIPPVQPTSTAVQPAGGPQFRYSTPAEDPDTIQGVILKGMNSTVTLTQKELYAISPDVRKFVKEQVTTKRVPTTTTTVSTLEEAVPDAASILVNHYAKPGERIVGKALESLRTIPVNLEGKLTVEGILDEGSQIIAIRRDVWEKLAVPMRPDQRLVMESANSSRDSTVGLLPDLRVSVDQCELYLQVQVVENASYEMLLGRPFLTLTQASTRHFANGDSHLTLVDPNTHQAVTIPTKPRIRSSQQGF